MTDPTYYCVQIFSRDGKRLTPCRLVHYPTAEIAEREAQRAAASSAGAIAFRFTGRPEFDIWGEAVLLAAHGDVPLVA